ncbi:MAG: PEPxxWA-CTERM sorting domain-containing protein [Phenylobacterium sp.]
MKTRLIAVLGSALFASLTLGGAARAQLSSFNFTYYAAYNEINPGFGFFGLTPIGSDSGVIGVAENRDIGGSDTAPNWPDAGIVYSADVTGSFNAPTNGSYLFTLGSDDGAYLYVDGGLVLNDGGIHGLTTVSGLKNLSTGYHSVEIEYGNLYCCGAVLDLSVASAPEPATWALMIGGFGLAGGALRRRRATVAA